MLTKSEAPARIKLLTPLSMIAVVHEKPNQFSTKACMMLHNHQQMANITRKRNVLNGEVVNGLN
jgi:hypothetical protein